MSINIIVAFTSKKFAIGSHGTIPWHLPTDMKHFKELTSNSTVIMGRKTFESIGSVPLPNRNNFVVTSNPPGSFNPDVTFVDPITITDPSFICKLKLKQRNTDNDKPKNDIFIIGGTYVYRAFMGIADNIYATIVEKEYDDADTFFPIENFKKYEIDTISDPIKENDISFRFIKYKLAHKGPHQEHIYNNLLKNILYTGSDRCDRTNTGVYSIFADQMRFNIQNSIPLLTAKRMPYKMIIKELLWFLRGETDSKILEKQGVHIWADNTSKEFLKDRGLEYHEGDLGPMYGSIWRAFGSQYKGCDQNYIGQGFDQITHIINSLKNDPYSRRHVMTSFNPAEVQNCVLMPCHGISIQFYVDDGKLSCHVYCRSSDCFLGLPFNIASYAIFTYIIALKTGYQPWELIMSLGDCHIYKNHLSQVHTQLDRDHLPFPKLVLNPAIKDKDWPEITVDDFTINGYICHPAISAPMAI
jgi:dihydrofolate reductase/thymidylate synthase